MTFGVCPQNVEGGLYENAPRCLPAVVYDELSAALSMVANTQNVLTIGPTFPPNTPRAEIAEDYFTGINRLIEAGRLRRDSPAVREVLSKLASYGRGLQSARPVQAFALAEKPADAFESELFRAFLLAID